METVGEKEGSKGREMLGGGGGGMCVCERERETHTDRDRETETELLCSTCMITDSDLWHFGRS